MKTLVCLLLAVAPSWGAFAICGHVSVSQTVTQNTDQTNYPLLVYLDASQVGNVLKTTGNGGQVTSASAFDVNFFSNNTCTVKYAWDLFSYDGTNGTVIAKVKIPSLSHTAATDIYVGVGDATITTFQGGAASSVYPTGTQVYYHMEGGSAADALNNFNGTKNGTVSTVTGQVGQGFGVSNPGNTAANFVNLGSTAIGVFNGSNTLVYFSTWINATSVSITSQEVAVGKAANGAAPLFRLTAGKDGSNGQVTMLYSKDSAFTGGYQIMSSPGSVITAGNFALVAGWIDLATPANCRLFINGALSVTGCTPGGTSAPTTLAALGANAVLGILDNTTGFVGSMDETLFASALPSGGSMTDWEATHFNNENAPKSFEITSNFGVVSMACTPATIPANTAGVSLTCTGTGTTWTAGTPGTPTFTVSGVSGVSKTAQTISSATSASLNLTTGSTLGTLTVSDGTISTTVTVVLQFPNSNVFVSPGLCTTSAGVMTCYDGGGYLKFNITGVTSITLNVDTTVNSASTANQMPSVKTIAVGPAGTADTVYTTVQFPANNTAGTPITAISGLTSGTTYTITIYLGGADQSQAGCYTGTVCERVIQSIQASGGTISAATLRPKRCIFFGDSYLQAYFGSAVSGAYYTNVDPTWSWAFYMAAAAGCEWSTFGVGGQGYVQTGQGNYPIVSTSWSNYKSGIARTFTAIDYVFAAEGLNDHGQSGATITTNATTLLTAIRAQLPAAKIFVVTPINPKPLGGNATSGSITANIASAVGGLADPQIYLATPPAEFQNATFTSGAPVTWCSPDGLHLNGGTAGQKLDSSCQGLIGYTVALKFQQATGGGGGSVPIQ